MIKSNVRVNGIGNQIRLLQNKTDCQFYYELFLVFRGENDTYAVDQRGFKEMLCRLEEAKARCVVLR